jgi:hypothetical protein
MKTAPKPCSLPKSIWRIVSLARGNHVASGTPLYMLGIERRGTTDLIRIYSKEGAPPVVGGLLERMTRPQGGEAAIWTNAKAAKESMGGGYTFAAVPAEWGFPSAEPSPEPRSFKNLTLGIPWTDPAPAGDR